MSDKKCIDKQYLLESLRDFDKEILSKKYTKDNSTENPGTGSDITISVEDGNAIETKDDGIYVLDLSEDVATNATNIANVDDKVDKIKKWQKYLNTELEYGEMHVDRSHFGSSPTTGLSYINLHVGEILPFDIFYQGNIGYDTKNHSFKLKAGKTYRLFFRTYGWNTNDAGNINYTSNIRFHNITKNESFGYCTHTNVSSYGEMEMIYTPDEDCEVAVLCDSNVNSVSAYSCDWDNPVYTYSPVFTAQEIGRVIEIDPVNYVNEQYGIEDCPVGNIIALMGNTAPKHYLACDGTEYNIEDYPYLSQFIKDEFESFNHFGGDGVTTFAVPDLRGEFLRGTGTNSHLNQGSGANVGEHQDGTSFTPIESSSASGVWTSGYDENVIDADFKVMRSNWRQISSSIQNNSSDTTIARMTSRPTNTSVLYCIKYEPTYFLQVGSSTVDMTEVETRISDAIGAHTEAMKEEIRNGYQKILNEDIRWFQSSIVYSPAIPFSNKTIINFTDSNISGVTKHTASNKMELDNDGHIKLKAGITYVIDPCVMSYKNSNVLGYSVITSDGINIETGVNADTESDHSRYSTINDFSDCIRSFLYTPEKDCTVTLQIFTQGTDLSIYSIGITVYELKQPVYTKIDVGSYADQIGVETQDSPVGTIISYMGNNAPKSYLACDGNTYNIGDYPDLANHFKAEFGTVNYFGGDGTITFAVPDLRGEFLRGTGDNTHANQGNGDNPGVHQDGTSIPQLFVAGDGHSSSFAWITDPSGNSNSVERDSTKKSATNLYGSVISSLSQDGSEKIQSYTARPTNTSVQYCIKYQPTYVLNFENQVDKYSVNESIVGFWIDGKVLYEKTVEIQMPYAQINNDSSQYYILVPIDADGEIDFSFIHQGIFESLASDGKIYRMTLPFVNVNSVSSNVDIYTINTETIRIQSQSNYFNSPTVKMTVTVRYTKK